MQNEKKPLNFSYNWNNKLNCKAFTSIRLSGRYEIGEVLDITLKGEPVKKVKVFSKKKIFVTDLSEEICRLDTGYDKFETIQILSRMYPNKDFRTAQHESVYIYFFCEA